MLSVFHKPKPHDEAENLPDGVFLIKKTAYDTAWNDNTHKGNIKETRSHIVTKQYSTDI